MKKQLLIIGIIVLLVCVGLSGCDTNQISNSLNTEKNKFVGTWTANGATFSVALGNTVTFFSDGTASLFGGIAGNYEIKDGNLTVTMIASSTPLQYTFSYSFSNNNTVLTVFSTVEGSSFVYTKQ